MIDIIFCPKCGQGITFDDAGRCSGCGKTVNEASDELIAEDEWARKEILPMICVFLGIPEEEGE